ncbi:ATPase, partial [Dactylosporangium sp. NPDC051485]
LAPAVSELAAAGDPVAAGLAEEAARLLLHSLETVTPEDAGAPAVVLAGSVLLSPGPVAARVRDGIVRRFGNDPYEARDGAAGAAWLAILQVGAGAGDPAAHSRLTADGGR